ncbi:uncharacterized protein ACRADG_001833 [Cochliomyia hominivorax]
MSSGPPPRNSALSDLPENLQIKREPSPPSTPEDKAPNSIKAKLNLHVKRRLQDYNQTTEESPNIITSPSSKPPPTSIDVKQEPTQKTEIIRQKRPYNKRSDKIKSVTQTVESSNIASASTTTTPQRKYKHKIKQIVSNDSQESLNEEPPLASGQNATITAGAISAGDEDEGGHDNELKTNREKEKCPDVLAMVLSMKKRALMQDPEVQNFLKEVMEVIKN